eukprot:TRINITY_DN11702_c0_g1_i1.p1 TRINITY_DN11702_c0_g1~~TRINITY_DN11702_c0_g1_i1.p1  ORF type:complete len:247 (-),score=30.56 TRINITY_DN11702_c0_g1_i1:478-1218(-)
MKGSRFGKRHLPKSLREALAKEIDEFAGLIREHDAQLLARLASGEVIVATDIVLHDARVHRRCQLYHKACVYGRTCLRRNYLLSGEAEFTSFEQRVHQRADVVATGPDAHFRTKPPDIPVVVIEEIKPTLSEQFVAQRSAYPMKSDGTLSRAAGESDITIQSGHKHPSKLEEWLQRESCIAYVNGKTSAPSAVVGYRVQSEVLGRSQEDWLLREVPALRLLQQFSEGAGPSEYSDHTSLSIQYLQL